MKKQHIKKVIKEIKRIGKLTHILRNDAGIDAYNAFDNTIDTLAESVSILLTSDMETRIDIEEAILKNYRTRKTKEIIKDIYAIAAKDEEKDSRAGITSVITYKQTGAFVKIPAKKRLKDLGVNDIIEVKSEEGYEMIAELLDEQGFKRDRNLSYKDVESSEYLLPLYIRVTQGIFHYKPKKTDIIYGVTDFI